MNRLEAKAKCKEFGINRDLPLEELAALTPESEALWLRSRTFLDGDEVPTHLEQKAAKTLAMLKKSRDLATGYAS